MHIDSLVDWLNDLIKKEEKKKYGTHCRKLLKQPNPEGHDSGG